MKRFNSTNSFGSSLNEEKRNPNGNCVYSKEFQAMLDGLDDEDSIDETGQAMDKKRRLSIHQVKALEKIFEFDSKLDPEKKVKLAQELGLQPRQVAIWFQNRRARWKTKQLERDYNHLKANYESLKQNHKKLEQDKDNLIAEVRELKAKLKVENGERNHSHKEKAPHLGTQRNASGHDENSPVGLSGESELANNMNLIEIKGLMEFKEGLSDSDSSGILNSESNLHAQFPMPPTLSSSDSGSTLPNISQFYDSRTALTGAYQQQLMRMEDQCVLGSEEGCNIFSVDQAPTLCWYFPDQAN